MAYKKKLYQIMQITFEGYETRNGDIKVKEPVYKKIGMAENQVAALIEAIQDKYYDFDNVEMNFIPELLQISFQNYPEDKQYELIDEVFDGRFKYDGKTYIRLCKSSSMSRVNKLILIEKSLYKQLRSLISLGLHDRFKADEQAEVIFSKLESYIGLALSSVLLVDYVPKGVCIVPEHKQFIDMPFVTMEEGDDTPIVKQGCNVTLHDGMGLHSHEVGCRIAKELGIKDVPVAFQLRVYPAVKGVSIEFDFKSWCAEYEVTHIKDIYNKEWSVEEIDCIWSASMFKFNKYFKSWKEYDGLRREMYEPLGQYNMGISSWTKPDAPEMVQMNYQYLQCLNIKGKNLYGIAKHTRKIIEDIYKNDVAAAYAFLGLVAKESENDDDIEQEFEDKITSSNILTALQTNPEILFRDPYIKKHIARALERTILNLKMGKPYVSGSYMLATQDPILFMETITGKEPKGVLKAGEFYSTDLSGERAIFRSPCIHSCQPCKGNFVNNELTAKWFSKYKNVIVFNGFGLEMQQLAGEDVDGDKNCVIHDRRVIDAIITDYKVSKPAKIDSGLRDDEGNVISKPIKYIKLDKEGKPLINELGDYVTANLWVDFFYPNLPIINENEKNTAQAVRYSYDNLRKFEKDSLNNLISTITNLSTLYTNLGAAKGNPDKYYDDLVSLAIMQGVEIDSAKTGVHAVLSKKMKKDKRYIPYFMKYKYPYREKDISDYADDSPLNMLCRIIERWEQRLFRKKGKCYLFDDTATLQYKKSGTYLMDTALLQQDKELTQKVKDAIKPIMDAFYDEQGKMIYNKVDDNEEWHFLYAKYGIIVDALCDKFDGNVKLLASAAVSIDYLERKSSKRTCGFAWSFLFKGMYDIIKSKSNPTKKMMLKEYKHKSEVPAGAKRTQNFEGRKYCTFSIDYTFDESLSKKIEDKKTLKPFSKDIDVVGLDGITADSVKKLMEQDNNIILHDRPYTNKKGETIHATGIYQGSMYLGSIKASSEIDTINYIDLAEYKDQKGTLKVTETSERSYKGIIGLMI